MEKQSILNYHETICREIEIKEGFLKTLIDHDLSIGTYRENVLKNAIKSRLPQNYTIGKGFVVSKEWCSTEIDILIYDSSFPVLFKEDDFVIITPDAVKCIIEVKSTAKTEEIQEGVRKLANNSKLIRNTMRANNIFSGFFAFSTEVKNLYTLKQKLILGLLDINYNKKSSSYKHKISKIRSLDIEKELEYKHINDICICNLNSELPKKTKDPSKTEKVTSYFNEIIIRSDELNNWAMTEIDKKYEEAIFINDIIHFLCPETYKNNKFLWDVLNDDIEKNDLGNFNYKSEIKSIVEEYRLKKAEKDFHEFVLSYIKNKK